MDENFRIDFDPPGSVYHAGQTVTGRVFLDLQHQQTKRFKAVRIQSTAKSTADLKTYDTFWTSSEAYFKYNLFRSQDGMLRGSDTSDIYLYPFNLTLPTSIPPSFEGQHGYVRYKVTATVEWAWQCDWKAEKVFLVVNPCDLNAEKSVRLEPIYQEVVGSPKGILRPDYLDFEVKEDQEEE